MATPYTYTSSGKRLTITSRSGVKPANLGKEIDGKIYQKPRLSTRQFDGSAVKVTNPQASLDSVLNKRTPSLGMGNVLQRGRSRDIPGQVG